METLVHYIMCEPYMPIPSLVKFPAFDNAKQFVGMYQLMESESGPQAAGNGTSTSCSFCPTVSDNVPVSRGWTRVLLSRTASTFDATVSRVSQVDVITRLQDHLSRLLEEVSNVFGGL
jgi:hypothetical protein